jgi:hypothetical protein
MLIESFAPSPDAVETHRIEIAASCEAVYQALWTADLGSSAVVKGLLALAAHSARLARRQDDRRAARSVQFPGCPKSRRVGFYHYAVLVSHRLTRGWRWRSAAPKGSPYVSAGLWTERGQDAMLGELKHHPRFASHYVAPRAVEVWLPPHYQDTPSHRFPVIYMHDGQNLFNP